MCRSFPVMPCVSTRQPHDVPCMYFYTFCGFQSMLIWLSSCKLNHTDDRHHVVELFHNSSIPICGMR
ncbi:hypothetical protein VTO73DRAFT_9295 [Trametes versicolor]